MAAQLGGTAVALALVLALAWLGLRALQRLQERRAGTRPGDDTSPQVMHSVGLSPRERLVTVRWRGRDYLLGVSAGSVNRIDDRAAETSPLHSGSGPQPGA